MMDIGKVDIVKTKSWTKGEHAVLPMLRVGHFAHNLM